MYNKYTISQRLQMKFSLKYLIIKEWHIKFLWLKLKHTHFLQGLQSNEVFLFSPTVTSLKTKKFPLKEIKKYDH